MQIWPGPEGTEFVDWIQGPLSSGVLGGSLGFCAIFVLHGFAWLGCGCLYGLRIISVWFLYGFGNGFCMISLWVVTWLLRGFCTVLRGLCMVNAGLLWPSGHL